MIGMFTFAFYLAVAVGQVAGVAPAVPWLVLMATASILSWFADQFQGRRAAVAAAAIFFVLGIVSPIFFAIVFLVAVVLCVIGFVDYRPGRERPE